MSWTGINDIYLKLNAKADKKLTACEWSVLLFICSQTDGLKDFYGKGRKMSFSYIAEGTGYCLREIKYSVRKLEQVGYIKVSRNGNSINIIEPTFHYNTVVQRSALGSARECTTGSATECTQIKKEALGSLTSPTTHTSITAPADAAPIEERNILDELDDKDIERLTRELPIRIEIGKHLSPFERKVAIALGIDISEAL